MSELFLSLFYEKCTEFTGVDWWITETIHKVWNAADVIQMTVGDDECSDLVFVFLEIFYVRKDVINARSLTVAKLDAGIDNNDVVFVFNHHHVFADFFDTA